MPFVSYFCVGTDLTVAVHRPQWIVPTSYQHAYHGFLAPESPWSDLLCERIAEFLTAFPVEWLLFDWFVYGSLHTDDFSVQPAWFAKEPFGSFFHERHCAQRRLQHNLVDRHRVDGKKELRVVGGNISFAWTVHQNNSHKNEDGKNADQQVRVLFHKLIEELE